MQIEVGDTTTKFEHPPLKNFHFAKDIFQTKFAHWGLLEVVNLYTKNKCIDPLEMRANPTISITGGTATNTFVLVTQV